MKIKNKKLFAVVLCIVFIVVVISAMAVKHYAVGPRYINDSAVLKEQVIYYKGNEYVYYGSGKYNSDIKSGKCIKKSLFETYYLGEGGDEYLIRSQLHERDLYVVDKGVSYREHKTNDIKG